MSGTFVMFESQNRPQAAERIVPAAAAPKAEPRDGVMRTVVAPLSLRARLSPQPATTAPRRVSNG